MNTEANGTRDWASYYAKTGFRPPRPTLLHALDSFDREGGAIDGRYAVDLGCGNGRDVVEILRRGWRVLAIDKEESAIQGLLARPDLSPNGRLETRVCGIENAAWPKADLCNSSFALPFCAPERFPEVWSRIVGSLRPGGRFSGQLFGNRDSWAARDGVTVHHRSDLDMLLAPFEVEHLGEEEEDGVTPRGTSKHWHIWHIVARKPL